MSDNNISGLHNIPVPEGERIASLAPAFPEYAICTNGDVWSFKNNRWLTPQINKLRGKGYVYIGLCSSGPSCSMSFKCAIHRLVAKAFIPCPGHPDKYDVNHKDGNPQNNHVSNLEWLTHTANLAHAANTGLSKVYPTETIHKICRLLQDKSELTDQQIADLTDTNRMTVNYIKIGKTHRYISKDYDFSNCNRKQKVSDAVIHEICKAIARGLKTTEIARVFGVASEYISSIKSGTIRKDIGSQYGIFDMHRGVGAPREVIEKMCVLAIAGFTDTEIVRLFDNKYSLTLVNSLRRGKTHTGVSKQYFTEKALSRVECNKLNIELKANVEGVYRMGSDSSSMLQTLTTFTSKE